MKRTYLREAVYQARLIKTLTSMFPGCFIIKNDPAYIQGMPDLLILFGTNWAMLEVKASETAPIQVNQEYFIDALNSHSFAAFIYPENEEEVLRDLQRAFSTDR